MALRRANVPALNDAELAEYFEQLFAEYRGPILNYLYRVVGDPGVAEDLTQDAFTRAWRARAQLASVENPRAWLYRIATNAARDHLRRRRLLAWLPLSGESGRQPLLASASHEEMVLESERMRQALLKLSPDNRVALVLYTCQECSVAEIAEALGITPEAARQRLVRARRQLREAFE
jgi:RNA polymerase sigma-70 factor (ECF subfamily)